LHAAGFTTAFGAHAVAANLGVYSETRHGSLLTLGILLALYDGAEVLLILAVRREMGIAHCPRAFYIDSLVETLHSCRCYGMAIARIAGTRWPCRMGNRSAPGSAMSRGVPFALGAA
jgi:hypothetical protein